MNYFLSFLFGCVVTFVVLSHFTTPNVMVSTLKPIGCVEADSIITDGAKRVVLHFRDCPGGGTIDISSNKPIFGKAQTAKIMGSDNVIGLDGVGFGYRLDTEADRRTCTIKYQYSRAAVTDTICSIIDSF